jgi:hypothetical protein
MVIFVIDKFKKTHTLPHMNSADAQAFADWQSKTAAEIADSHSHIYRECALAMMRVMHLAVAWTSESQIKAWGVMFAIGHPYCLGQSMSVVASQLRVSRATISNAATEFCKAAQIPPSTYMKSEQAQETARKSRNKTK